MFSRIPILQYFFHEIYLFFYLLKKFVDSEFVKTCHELQVLGFFGKNPFPVYVLAQYLLMHMVVFVVMFDLKMLPF